MPVPYNAGGISYPQATKRILMIGLGTGSISTYLGRAMPDAKIDVVELDPGVIAAGKQYFGLRGPIRSGYVADRSRPGLTGALSNQDVSERVNDYETVAAYI